MSFVAIIGAGDLGGAVAHTLAGLDRVGRILLVDRQRDVAAGKALDIQQAAGIEGFRTRLEAAGDPTAAVGADAVVFADDVSPDPAAPPDECLTRLERLAALDGGTTFVCAGASHEALMARAVGDLHLSRARLVGSAPLAYAAAIRALLGLAIDRSPSQIALPLVGLPPARGVVLWSGATVEGAPLEQVAGAAAIAAVRRQIPALWPPGTYALASAAARVTDALVNGSRRQFTCFVALDGELGVRGRVSAMPVEIGPGGVRRVIVPPMSGPERVALQNAIGR